MLTPLKGLQAPEGVLAIVRTLESAGFEAWAVGGAIRDRIMGLRGGDWDLATGARPSDVQSLFRRTVPVGVDHGTVGVLQRDGTLVEVTTFRRDVVPLGRRAVVEFADSIDEDLGRRDFTLNAIAWHPLRKEIRDPFEGLKDLERRLLRAVGDADQRFVEDHLRILRALRFAGRFSLTIEESTWDAIVRRCDQTRTLSAERIRDELVKVVSQQRRPSRSLALYRASGLMAALFPDLEAAFVDAGAEAWTRALATIDRVSARDPLTRLVPLLGPMARWGGGESVGVFLARLRFSNAEVDRLLRMAVGAGPIPPAAVAEVEQRRWLHRAGSEWRSLLALALAGARVGREGFDESGSEVLASVRALRRQVLLRPPLRVSDLAIGGRDLIAHGYRPGPQFGVVLEWLLDRVIDDPGANVPDRLLAWVEEWREAQT